MPRRTLPLLTLLALLLCAPTHAAGQAGKRTARAGAARPPWGWFDRGEPALAPGAWFFDPASAVKRHLGRGEDFPTAYLHAPFLGVTRRQDIK